MIEWTWVESSTEGFNNQHLSQTGIQLQEKEEGWYLAVLTISVQSDQEEELQASTKTTPILLFQIGYLSV